MRDDLDPETLRAIRAAMDRQVQIDYEDAGPKAPHGDVVHKGVLLSSRWSLVHEYNAMRRAIDAMPELMARRLESVFCDSNAGLCYTVLIKPEHYLDDLPYVIDQAFRSLGGYNGLSIESEGRRTPYCGNPWWPEDELDDIDSGVAQTR